MHLLHSSLIHTVPGDRVSASQIVAALSKTVASAVGKPESYVLVSLKTDTPMSFGGSEEPCAFAELISIGTFRDTAAISAAIMATVEKELGVSSSRFYIKFTACSGSEMGWQGATF